MLKTQHRVCVFIALVGREDKHRPVRGEGHLLPRRCHASVRTAERQHVQQVRPAEARGLHSVVGGATDRPTSARLVRFDAVVVCCVFLLIFSICIFPPQSVHMFPV